MYKLVLMIVAMGFSCSALAVEPEATADVSVEQVQEKAPAKEERDPFAEPDWDQQNFYAIDMRLDSSRHCPAKHKAKCDWTFLIHTGFGKERVLNEFASFCSQRGEGFKDLVKEKCECIPYEGVDAKYIVRDNEVDADGNLIPSKKRDEFGRVRLKRMDGKVRWTRTSLNYYSPATKDFPANNLNPNFTSKLGVIERGDYSQSADRYNCSTPEITERASRMHINIDVD